MNLPKGFATRDQRGRRIRGNSHRNREVDHHTDPTTSLSGATTSLDN